MSLSNAEQITRSTHASQNRLRADDRAAHDWYRFVLSFPAHLVRDYVERFGLAETARNGATVLDPFCGTETTSSASASLVSIGSHRP
jgi:hypothetical protein